MYYYLNSSFCKIDSADKISSRIDKYSDCLFETIKIINKNPMFLNYHIDRLKQGALLLHFELLDQIELNSIQDIIVDLLNKNNLNHGARVKITLSRKDGGFYLPKTSEIDFKIECYLSSNSYDYLEEGIELILFTEHKKPIHKLFQIKSGQCILYVLAAIFAQKNKTDDAIIINGNDKICETSSSNIFFVKKKQIFTPSIQEGILDGVMRKIIIEIALKNNYTIIESCIDYSFLKESDEVFITNAIQGIQWVKKINNKFYTNKISKELHSLLINYSHTLL